MMVVFELINIDGDILIYYYWPNGNKDKKPGVIVADRKNKSVIIKEIAEDDFEGIITAEELNEMTDSWNEDLIAEGKEPCWEYVDYDLKYCFFGTHAVEEIKEAINQDSIKEKGASAWY